MEERFAGRVIVEEGQDSKDVVVTVLREDEEGEVTFSTEKENGDIYLVMKIKDLKEFFK